MAELIGVPKKLDTEDFGRFDVRVYGAGGVHHLTLSDGDLGRRGVLCRIQSECIGQMVLDKRCDCRVQLEDSLRLIRASVSAGGPGGIVVLLRRQALPSEYCLDAGGPDEPDFAIAADILQGCGIRSVELISLNRKKIESLRARGIEITRHVYHGGDMVRLDGRVERMRERIRRGESHALFPADPDGGRVRVLVLGDLNVDQLTEDPARLQAGGSGLHAARAFQASRRFLPMLFGKVGSDANGRLVRDVLCREGIRALIGTDPVKATGSVKVVTTTTPHGGFEYRWDKINNANDYHLGDLNRACDLVGLCEADYAYISSYLLVQKLFDVRDVRDVLLALQQRKARLFLDLARKSLSKDVLGELRADFGREQLEACLDQIALYGLSVEAATLRSLAFPVASTNRRDFDRLFDTLGPRFIIFAAVDQSERKRMWLIPREGDSVCLDGELDWSTLGSGDRMVVRGLEMRHEPSVPVA